MKTVEKPAETQSRARQKPIKTIVLVAVILFFSGSINLFGQQGDAISDFYEYANKEWLNTTVIPENSSVVNNWGLLWDEITDKSIEILSGETEYDLDENHQYALAQLQNFYASTASYSNDSRKRVYLVQKHYPLSEAYQLEINKTKPYWESPPLKPIVDITYMITV